MDIINIKFGDGLPLISSSSTTSTTHKAWVSNQDNEFYSSLKKIAKRFNRYLTSVQYMSPIQPPAWYLITKRVIDIFVGILGIILLSPLFLVIAIAIKLDSSGPVFYSQKRVGKNGKIFMIHKFRTMVKNAETKTGPVWAKENDPRVTTVGKVLRRKKMDELPQLWNLLKGEMSFVGPRPERPEFTEKIIQIMPAFARRVDITPGITGLAQLRSGYDNSPFSVYRKLRFDVKYMNIMSLSVDIRLFWETLRAVLWGRKKKKAKLIILY